MNKAICLCLSTIVAAVVLVGCGGSSAPVSSASSFQKYEDLLNRLMKTSSSVASTNSQPSRSVSATTPKSVGQKYFESLRSKIGVTRDGDGGNGWGGGSMVGEIYFDDTHGVWCRIDSLDTQVNEQNEIIAMDYLITHWLDQALTQPAGQLTYKTRKEGTKSISDYRLTYTAGKSKGYVFYNVYSIDSATGDVSSVNEFNDPSAGFGFKGTSSFVAQTGAWGYEYVIQFADGTTQEYSASFTEGEQRYRTKDSAGYVIEMVQKADGSGSIKITGNDSRLPANGVWDTTLKGVLTFADGTTTNFDLLEGTFNF